MDQELELTLEQVEDLEEQSKRHIGFWNRLGGGALTFAILFHVIVIILGAIWIFQIIPIPEKKIDFMPGGGGGGGERGAETKVQTKKRAQITPTSNVKRVFAEGAKSQYSIPDPGDTFGEMATSVRSPAVVPPADWAAPAPARASAAAAAVAWAPAKAWASSSG